jgi:hypothetical protein
MKNSNTNRFFRWLAVFCIGLCALTVLPLVSSAQPSASINIVNNSNREIRHVYLSPVGSDTWTANQLTDSVIASGQSFTIDNSACDQQQIKVIAEDQNGCFSYEVVTCGGDSSWTITNSTVVDCGN